MSERDRSKRAPGDEALRELATVAAERSRHALGRILSAASGRLHMDVCLLGEVSGAKEIICAAVGDTRSFRIGVGQELPLEESFAQLVLDGRITSPIPDAAADLRVAGLPMTRRWGVGGYIGAPVKFSEGRVFGVLECMSHRAAPWLGDRDLKFVQVLARLAADEVEREQIESEKDRLEAERIRSVLAEGALSVVFQPIMDLHDGTIIGMEALARFGTEPQRSPASWFADAALVGLRTDLELLAVAAALAQLESLPQTAYLSINVSPDTLVSPRFAALLDERLGGRVVLELPERALDDKTAHLREAIDELRRRGARVAIDDTTAGIGSLARLHRLLPDIIKLDISLTRDIDKDPIRRSLVTSLLSFAQEIGATVSAEGIETRAQADTLRAMGVMCGQGWFLAEPGPLAEVTRTLDFAQDLSWVDEEDWKASGR